MTIQQIAARATPWLDGVAVAAQDMRLGVNAAMSTAVSTTGTTGIAACAGVRPGVGTPLACTWVSGLGFNLSAGICSVQGTASATAGMYTLTLDTTTLLTCTTADPTNPRIDSVIAVVVDNGNATSTALFKILPGTPAASPVAPALPANALLLCNIAVAANAVALSSGNFTDKRVWMSAIGGILLVNNAALGTTVGGPSGSYVDDLATGRLRRLDSSGNARAPKPGAFTPVSSYPGSVGAGANTSTTIATVSVTTDGSTEIEIYASWLAVRENTSPAVGDQLNCFLRVDGVDFNGNTWIVTQQNTNNAAGQGGSFSAFTTPSAATHTITMVVSNIVASGWTVNNPYLRVSPAFN
jgi:hypothetical protein